eukprot:TRINITY_DN10882_c2_g1_i1.p1 TRINITY_DN10882_c2_g1~~TRINITY_DN10882_c2_g1_i1.p1  ORF type:complete len:2175 (+),score=627.18 TRINITY_DN10882_c2_g1_i1:76-6525(+)
MPSMGAAAKGTEHFRVEFTEEVLGSLWVTGDDQTGQGEGSGPTWSPDVIKTAEAPERLDEWDALSWARREVAREGRAGELTGRCLPFERRERAGAHDIPLVSASFGYISGSLSEVKFCAAVVLPALFRLSMRHGARSVRLETGQLPLLSRETREIIPGLQDCSDDLDEGDYNDGLESAGVSIRATVPFSSFGGALVHGTSVLLPTATVRWLRVETIETEHYTNQRTERVSPMDLSINSCGSDGHAVPSWAAWSGARVLRLEVDGERRVHRLLSLMHRNGVRLWCVPRLSLCSAQSCCVRSFLEGAAGSVLPGAAAFGIPAEQSGVALAMLSLLPLAACSAAALLGGAVVRELQQLRPPQLAAARDALEDWLRSRGMLQAEQRLLQVVREAALMPQVHDGPAGPAALPKRVVLTLTPSGAQVDTVADGLPDSRGMRLARERLSSLHPGYGHNSEFGIVQVRLRDDDGEHPSACGAGALQRVHAALFDQRIELPAHLGGGTLPVTPLHWSQSQMKEASLLAVLLPGRTRRQALDWTENVRLDLLMRNEDILKKKVPKRSARLSLFFTEDGRRLLGRMTYRVIDDITFARPEDGQEYNYTDGSGLIDTDSLREGWLQLYRGGLVPFEDPPAVIQIRAAGCKGTLQSSPGLLRREGVQVIATKEMEKVKSPEDRLPLYVVGWARGSPLHMNVQAMLLLHARGTPLEVFLTRAARYAAAQLREICADAGAAWRLLGPAGVPLLWEPSAPADSALLSRIDPRREPGLCSVLLHVLRHRLSELRDRARFPVPKGRVLMMVPDFTKTLRHDEVFVRVRQADGSLEIIEGRVAALKMPTLHPRDLRMYKAVRSDKLEAQGIFNAVVYSCDTGAPPASLTQSGSDYDGDEGWITWDPELIPPATAEGHGGERPDALGNIEPYDYAALDEEGAKDGEHDAPKTYADLFLRVSTANVLGQLSVLHKMHGDRSSCWGQKAQQLAALCSKAVDAPKTGASVEIPLNARIADEDRPRYQQRDKRRRHQQEQFPPSTPLERVYEIGRHFADFTDSFLADSFRGLCSAEAPAVRESRKEAPAVPCKTAVELLARLPPGDRAELLAEVDRAGQEAEREAALAMRLHWIRREAEFATGLLERADGGVSAGKRGNASLRVEEAALRVARHARERIAAAAKVLPAGLPLPAGVGAAELAACAFHVAMTERASKPDKRNRRLLSLAWIPLRELARAAPAAAAAPPPPPPGLAEQAEKAAAAGEDRAQLLQDAECIDSAAVGAVRAADGACGLDEEEVRRVLRSVNRHDVTVIVAPTGRGKSTLVPRLLLEHGCFRGEPRIVVSQPRRVACHTLASRVAADTGGELGGRVGYRVAGVAAVSDETELTYMTEVLVYDHLLHGEHFTHIVVDEVHQQSLHLHMLLATTRRLLRMGRRCKIVLMSATANAHELKAYMEDPCTGLAVVAPSVNIVDLARSHRECDVYYIDKVVRDGKLLREALQWLRAPSDPVWISGTLWEVCKSVSDALFRAAQRDPWREEMEWWLGGRSQRDVFTYLTAAAACDVYLSRAANAGRAVVVFLPGREVVDVREWVHMLLENAAPYQQRPETFLCEGQMPIEEQQRALQQAADSGACFCFCTNVLESSITFPTTGADPVVVDTLVEKRREENGALVTAHISRSQAEQRKGRTARRARGEVYRLAAESAFRKLPEHLKPDDSGHLAEVLLRVLGRESVGVRTLRQAKTFLRQLPSAPPEGAVDQQLKELLAARAVVRDGAGGVRRTLVGELLQRHGMDPRVALLVVECCRYGDCGVLGCLAAAVLRQRGSLFLSGSSPAAVVAAVGMQSALADGQSDLLPEMAVLAAHVAQEYGVSHMALLDAAGVYDELAASLAAVGLDGAVRTQQLEAAMRALPVPRPSAVHPPWGSDDVTVFRLAVSFAFAHQCFKGWCETDPRAPDAEPHLELKLYSRGSRGMRNNDAVRRGLVAHMAAHTVKDSGEFVVSGKRARWREIFYKSDSVSAMRRARQFLNGVSHPRVSKVECNARWLLQSVQDCSAYDHNQDSHLVPCVDMISGRGPVFVACNMLRFRPAEPGQRQRVAGIAMKLTRSPLSAEIVGRGLQGGAECRFREFEQEEEQALWEAEGETAQAIRECRKRIQSARSAAVKELLSSVAVGGY